MSIISRKKYKTVQKPTSEKNNKQVCGLYCMHQREIRWACDTFLEREKHFLSNEHNSKLKSELFRTHVYSGATYEKFFLEKSQSLGLNRWK